MISTDKRHLNQDSEVRFPYREVQNFWSGIHFSDRFHPLACFRKYVFVLRHFKNQAKDFTKQSQFRSLQTTAEPELRLYDPSTRAPSR